MTTALSRTPTSQALRPQDPLQRLAEDFFTRRENVHTRAGYRQDMRRFCRFLGLADELAALRHLCALGAGPANLCVMEYRDELRVQKVAPATINRRLSTLRSFMRLAQRTGIISWALSVDGVRARTYRDTRGPPLEHVQRLLDAAAAQPQPVATRDSALLWLMFTLGLRSIEVRELELQHLDVAGSRVFVRGKGREEREPQNLKPETKSALLRWVKLRGPAPGPLFTRVLHGKIQLARPLSRFCIWKLVHDLGAAAGVRVWPHGLRHTAITEGLEATKGDVRTVRAFSRHARIDTLMHYDDARRDAAGTVSALLEARLQRPRAAAQATRYGVLHRLSAGAIWQDAE